MVSANWLLLNWTIQAHTREQWLVSNSHLDYTTEYYLPRGLPAIGVVLPIHDASPPTEIRAKRLCHIAAYPKWLDRFKHDVPVTIAIGLLLAAQKPELLDDLHCVELTNDDLEFLLNPVRFGCIGKFPFKRNKGLVACLIRVLRIAKLLVRDTLVAPVLRDRREAQLLEPLFNRVRGFL